MDIARHIDIYYGGVQAKFAKELGVNPQQVTKWIANKYVIIDGIIYSPLRSMEQFSRSNESIIDGKHAVNILIEATKKLKRASSANVSEFRSFKHEIEVECHDETTYKELEKEVKETQKSIEPFLELLNYHSRLSTVIVETENYDPQKNVVKVVIKDSNPQGFVQNIYRDLFIYSLRSRGFQALQWGDSLRSMEQFSGSDESTIDGKHEAHILIDAARHLKRASSAFVSEFRSFKHEIKVEYQFESRYEDLEKKVKETQASLEPLLELLNYHSRFSTVIVVIENYPQENVAKVVIKDSDTQGFVQDIYRDLFIYSLRSRGFQAMKWGDSLS
ncbi:hypothetical protein [Pectobacterium carotovorum]|uniref:hypothetical protein n=1 Tax=Pectobacterium carotovorum TaxID=554 RepID=UPI0015DF0433|nr:hypothetical protein [Pectobacterium carotovorum]MBA0176925.1 hypothetical protein [Pectobacterium carotovorum]